MLDYARKSRRRSSYFTLSIPNFGRFGKFNNFSNTPKDVLISRIFKYSFFGLIGLILLMAVLFIWYGRDLPAPGKLVEAQVSQSSGIYDRNGELLFSVYQNQNRIYVTLDKIPKFLRQGTIAIEDKSFYENEGFSITGYIRGLIIDPILRQRVTGGSTITQQLVKNVLLTSERSLPRKIKELMLAIQVDRKYTKDEILEMYLNDVPYGGTAIGVQAASQIYFNKDVKDLNLSESAFLAGLPQSPSTYSPFSGDKYYLSRTKNVLAQMESQGYITKNRLKQHIKKLNKRSFQIMI